jgi:tRNA threonylcarbamoyladenosine biosynthesis protein TsaE
LDIDELDTLPWQEALFGGGVAVIEWPDRLGRLLPAERWDIKFSIIDERNRELSISAHGRKNRQRMVKWVQVFERIQMEERCWKITGII